MAAKTSRLARFTNLEFVLGASLTTIICLAVIFSDVLFPGGADKIDLMARLAKPFAKAAHPLGTDPLGRDVLARVVAGGKISQFQEVLRQGWLVEVIAPFHIALDLRGHDSLAVEWPAGHGSH